MLASLIDFFITLELIFLIIQSVLDLTVICFPNTKDSIIKKKNGKHAEVWFIQIIIVWIVQVRVKSNFYSKQKSNKLSLLSTEDHR